MDCSRLHPAKHHPYSTEPIRRVEQKPRKKGFPAKSYQSKRMLIMSASPRKGDNKGWSVLTPPMASLLNLS